MADPNDLPPSIAEWLTPDLTDGQVAWHLAMTALGGVRRRVEREGISRDAAAAFCERVNELAAAFALVAAERERGLHGGGQ